MDDVKDYSGQPSLPGESSPSYGGAATAARMKEQVSSAVSDARDKVADLGRQTINKLDESRQSAAGALDQTASSLHTGGDKISGAAHSAADSLQATADYVRQTDLKGMSRDLQDLVKRYPNESLAAAAVLGFLVARGLRGRD